MTDIANRRTQTSASSARGDRVNEVGECRCQTEVML